MRSCSRLQPSFKAQVRMLCFFWTPWYQMETLQQIHCQIMLLLTRKAGGYHHDSYLCQILLDFLWFSGVAGVMYYSRVFFQARSGTDLKSYTSKNALGVDPQNSFYKSNRSVFPCKAVAKHQIHSKKVLVAKTLRITTSREFLQWHCYSVLSLDLVGKWKLAWQVDFS